MDGADAWVEAAMTDDAMVVELLVRLHAGAPLPPTLPLAWAVRQRRSRSVTINAEKLARSQRASPSTPLSWSCGGTSLSGGSGGAAAGGCEESSRPQIQSISAASRSKINGDSKKAISKRSRKKKTLPELKDEENSLLKEKKLLKRGIVALRMNLEKKRAENEKLKRMKVELQPLPIREATSSLEQPSTTASHSTSLTTPPIIPGNAAGALQSSTSPPDAADSDAAFNTTFMLPDLNMPSDDPFPDIICTVS